MEEEILENETPIMSDDIKPDITPQNPKRKFYFKANNKSNLIPILLGIIILAMLLSQFVMVKNMSNMYNELLLRNNETIEKLAATYKETLEKVSADNKEILLAYAQAMENANKALIEAGKPTQDININVPGTNNQTPDVDTTPDFGNTEYTPDDNYQTTPDSTEPVEEFDTTPFLGISVDASTQGQSPIGVLLMDVIQSSPAALAGLQAGDIIMTVDGYNVTSLEDISSIIAQHYYTDTITITYARVINGAVEFNTISTQLTARGNFSFED